MKSKIILFATAVSLSLTLFAQVPPNNLIEDAIDVDQFPQPYTDTVDPLDGTPETEVTAGCDLSGNGAPSFVWYKFTATQNGILSVTYTNTHHIPGAPVFASSNGENATAADLTFETGNGNNTCGPSNSTTITTVAGTTYYVAVTHGGTFNVTLDISSSILSTNSFGLSENISLFPNPTSSNININTTRNFEMLQVNIFDVTGQNVITSNISGTTSSINTSNLVAGVYFAKISSKKESTTIKFIKK